MVVGYGRKRVGVSDVLAITQAWAPGDVWAIDFRFDSTVAGKPLKVWSVFDEHSREASGEQVEYSITAEDLTDQLDVLVIERGTPGALHMANGPGFISKALHHWANEVDLVFMTPGQPWWKGFIESFNGRLRDECLRVNQFYSLNHAKGAIGIWKKDYNTTRPHSSLGYFAPAMNAGQRAP